MFACTQYIYSGVGQVFSIIGLFCLMQRLWDYQRPTDLHAQTCSVSLIKFNLPRFS